MTISIWQANGSQPQREVDTLVIGAGLVGAAVAYFLAQMGCEVVITDARDAAMGASGRNAGFMITGLDTYYHRAIQRYGHATVREMWNISRQTHQHWRAFAARDHVSLVDCGSMLLAESETEKSDLIMAVRAMHADGIDVIYHDRDPLGRGYYAAIEQPWDAAVHPVELTRSILQQSGAELITNNEIYALEQTSPGCVTVYSQRWVFKARRVMLCTNAYSPRLHPYFVKKVIPTRAQVLVTEPLTEPLISTCGYSDYGFMYYRMTFDNRLLVGGGRKQNKPAENDTTDDRVTDPVQRILETYIRQHFPEAVERDRIRVGRRWSGIMGFTPDGLPLVGKLPEMPDVAFAVGFTGHGLSLGAATAERAADLLVNGTHPGALNADRLVR